VSDHLSGPSITARLERHFPYHIYKTNTLEVDNTLVVNVVRDTALHAGKDLVVAPSSFDEILPEGSRGLSALTSLWSPLSSRTTGVTRYLFSRVEPAGSPTGLHESMFGLSSHMASHTSDRLAWSGSIIPHTQSVCRYLYAMRVSEEYRRASCSIFLRGIARTSGSIRASKIGPLRVRVPIYAPKLEYGYAARCSSRN
jgi:hypothetical protein